MNDAELGAAVRSLITGTTGTIPDYELPEIPASSIDPATADGKTVQKDGSVWWTSTGEYGPAGSIHQEMYGYISKAKAPAMWDRMVKALGEERLVASLSLGGPWARYKTNPDTILLTGMGDALNLSFLLSNPIFPPT